MMAMAAMERSRLVPAYSFKIVCRSCGLSKIIKAAAGRQFRCIKCKSADTAVTRL